MPDSPPTGTYIVVKDATGDSVANNITVSTVTGSDLIDGVNNYIINFNYESKTFMFNTDHYEAF